jgi:hypothetical protein
MKSLCHWVLGRYLASWFMRDQSPLLRFFFKLGSVEPDFNPVTYLRGFKTIEHFRGHNYRNVCGTIEHLTFNLLYTGDSDVKTFYYLGKLCHYTTDAFTYPHNITFTGTIREHMRYEKRLKWYFIRFLHQNPTPPEIRPYSGTLFDMIEHIHQQYLCTKPSKENDVAFTFQTVSNIVQEFTELFSRSSMRLGRMASPAD